MINIKNKIKSIDVDKIISNYSGIIIEFLYYVLFSYVFIDSFLHTTMFTLSNHLKEHNIFIILMIIYIMFKCSYLTKFDSRAGLKFLASSSLILFIFMYEYFYAQGTYQGVYFELLSFAFLLIGAKDIPLKRIVTLAFVFTFALSTITIVASLTGNIQNLIYVQAERGSRFSLGFIYPTDFAAHICFMVLMWLYIRAEKLSIIEAILCLGIAAGLYMVCKARNSVICIGFAVAVSLFIKFKKTSAVKKGKQWDFPEFLKKRIAFTAIILAFIMFILSIIYEGGGEFIESINLFFSRRLMHNHNGIINFGIKLWSKYVPMVGFGGSTTIPKNYNFIDCSYMQMLLRYGIVIFVTIMVISVKCFRKADRKKDTYLTAILFITALHCFMEQHFVEVAYNPFFFCMFATLGDNNTVCPKKLMNRLKRHS